MSEPLTEDWPLTANGKAQLRNLAETAIARQVHPANWSFWIRLVMMAGPARDFIEMASPTLVIAMLDAERARPAPPEGLDEAGGQAMTDLRAVRSALKGARGLALDHEEADLDAELGRAIDIIDAISDADTLDAARPAPVDEGLDLLARRAGRRVLTFDNGRHENYEAIAVWHEPSGGMWDRILIARDDGTLADRIIAALAASPAPLDECEWCSPRHEWPCPTIQRCDEPGCEAEATCGWPTRPDGTGPNGGYRRTCGKHWLAQP